MTWTKDLGELYPGFSADMSACASKAAAAPGHGVPCPVCKAAGVTALIQGREAGMRAHVGVVHPERLLHPSQRNPQS